MKGQFDHVPVMGREVVELFLPVAAGLVVDATVGGGGHAALLLEARPDLRLLGVDRDADAVSAARERLAGFGQRVQVVQARFGELRDVVSERDEGEVIAVLFDLGVSSAQLDRPERGFSYRFDAPLDMRMDSSQSLTASDVVNHYDESRLASLIARFGEERFAGRIAAAIVAARPVHGTRELAEIVKTAIPAATRRRGPHPARRTFQAIRMEVNQELPDLAAGLDDAVHLVGPGGRVAVLAYHSLEDRMVKERFVGLSRQPELPSKLPVRDTRPPAPFRLLSRHALRPTPQEVEANPRAESARLRAVERRVDRAMTEEALAVEAIIVDALVVEADVVADDLETGDLEIIDVIELEPDGAAPDVEAPQIATGRHLRVAPDSVRRRRNVRIAAAAAAVSISATLFAVVGFNVELAQNQIKLQKLQNSLQSEQTRYYNLRSQVAANSAPAHIVSEATAHGYVTVTPTYLPAGIKPPPPDSTGTSAVLKNSTDATKGSLDPVQ